MLEIITDNRMSHNQSRYDLVFFRWNGAAYRFTELPEEIKQQADKVYPVTFEARQAASLAKRQAAEHGVQRIGSHSPRISKGVAQNANR